MKFIRKVAAVGAMGLTFAGLAAQIAQAQRPISLFSTQCVQRGYWDNDETRNISINRELFTQTSEMRVWNRDSSLVTCRIRPAGSAPKFKTLRLGFGIADDSQLPDSLEVNVYLDGSKAESRTVSRGDQAFILLDVTQASSVAIEVLPPTSGKYTIVSFVQTILEPISSSSSPGRRQ